MEHLSHSGIISVSRRSEVFTSFRGPLIQYQLVKSIDRETGLLRRWTVFSQGKRSTLVRYLFGKLLWDELNSFELKVFFHLHEVCNNKTIFLSLKALNTGLSKQILRERLKNGEYLGFWNITRQQYLSIKGRVNFFFLEETVNLRRVTKFSGYTKHHKDKGSLGVEREYYLSEILDPVYDISDEILFTYLIVGEIPLLGGVFRPDENQ